jgi:Zn-ribbon RNA-binding protein
MKLICTSCGTNVAGQEDFVKFNCPSCGEGVVIRCRKCKKHSNKYKCIICNFEGP